MKGLRFVVSLITQDNDYQVEQAVAAEEAARKLGVEAQIVYADNDSIQQSQQILQFVQGDPGARPHGIIFEPVGGPALPQVARAAVATGIAWVVLNREIGYIKQLRQAFKVPVFGVASDNQEIGRIHGRQLAALLPNGGSVLYIQGPSETDACKLRNAGLYETKPVNIQIKTMKGTWTESSAFKAVTAWLRLSTSQQAHIDVIAAQNDAMAAGAKKAFQQFSYEGEGRDRWLSVPFMGCDGVPKTGQAWVRSGLLTSTVIAPPLAGTAVEMLAHALQTGLLPPEITLMPPRSFPALETLVAAGSKKAQGASSAGV
ncbi:MAG TPA: substrate-binding domain-containing protein [Terriglobales bacterium]